MIRNELELERMLGLAGCAERPEVATVSRADPKQGVVVVASAEELGRKWFEAMSNHDFEGALETLADDVDFWSPAGPMRGREEVRPFLLGYETAFPDAVFDIKVAVGSENMTALEGTFSGKNTGPITSPAGEMPATGRDVSLPFVTVIETDGEHITSHHAYWDQMGFMAQLGLMPEQASA